ncbi:MAG: amino acid permease [Candidatus Eremiobacteraeota bacterium]|nr:amino acid permease [Candidatus Eremiobacteraeota bacterium]
MSNLWKRKPLDQLLHAEVVSEEHPHSLKKTLGPGSLVALGIGAIIGAGLFVRTAAAAAYNAGPSVTLAFIVAAVGCAFAGLCYAEFASMIPIAGSAYTYSYATLGELVAWIIGWDLILEYGLSLAPTASSLSDYFQHMLGNIGIVFPAWAQTANVHAAHAQIDLLACIVTLAVTLLVAAGIRESASVNGALVVLQIVSMLVFIVAVAHAIHPSNLRPFAPFGYHGVLASTALVFFAYIGFDTVTVASEEAKRPERNVPIGIILALSLGGILYVALTLCTVGVLRFDKLSDGAAMLDALGSVSKSHALYWIVAIGGLAGNTTVMLTSLLGQVRIFYVMARDRMLPPGVARIHHVFRTPARMTMITGFIVAIFAAVLPLTELLTLVNIGTLAAFAIVCAGVLVLRIVNPGAVRPFRAPLLPLFSIGGAAACLYLVTGLQVATWIRYGVWFLVGLTVYALYGFWNSRLRVELIEP